MTADASPVELPQEIDLRRLMKRSKKKKRKKLALTREQRRLFLRLLSRGNTRRTAAAVARIRCEDLDEWMERGKNEDRGEYSEFYLDVLQAEATAEIRLVNAIFEAAMDGDWKAAVWLLERRYPERWGRRG